MYYADVLEFSPGCTICVMLDAMNLSPMTLANRMGFTREQMGSLFFGEMIVDQAVADSLEKNLGCPAKFWLNVEENYRDKLSKWEV